MIARPAALLQANRPIIDFRKRVCEGQILSLTTDAEFVQFYKVAQDVLSLFLR